ncbi:hypothetical protein D3C80_712610 [compost metagenome]
MPALLVQLVQHGQLGVRGQAAAGVIDAQFAGHAGDHRRAVAGEQQDLPATLVSGVDQPVGVIAQAIVEAKPGERALLVAEQQPLTGFIGHGRCRLVAELADEAGLADAQATPADFALQPLARLAVHAFGSLRGAAEGAGDRVFRAAFQSGG